jgi:hypothetical protein
MNPLTLCKKLVKRSKPYFSPGTPASSTTKTGRHDIADVLLKVALSTNNHYILIIIVYVLHTHEQFEICIT